MVPLELATEEALLAMLEAIDDARLELLRAALLATDDLLLLATTEDTAADLLLETALLTGALEVTELEDLMLEATELEDLMLEATELEDLMLAELDATPVALYTSISAIAGALVALTIRLIFFALRVPKFSTRSAPMPVPVA